MKKEIICNNTARDLEKALDRVKSDKGTKKTEALINLLSTVEKAVNEIEFLSSQNEALLKLVNLLKV